MGVPLLGTFSRLKTIVIRGKSLTVSAELERLQLNNE